MDSEGKVADPEEMLPELPEYLQRDLSHMTWACLQREVRAYGVACIKAERDTHKETEAVDNRVLALWQIAEASRLTYADHPSSGSFRCIRDGLAALTLKISS